MDRHFKKWLRFGMRLNIKKGRKSRVTGDGQSSPTYETRLCLYHEEELRSVK